MIVMTRLIMDVMSENIQFTKELTESIKKYFKGDWGDMCEEDKMQMNDIYRKNNDRVVGIYDTSEGEVYIVTEKDRSITRILFSDECLKNIVKGKNLKDAG